MHNIISYRLVYYESNQTLKQPNPITNPIMIIPTNKSADQIYNTIIDTILQNFVC